MTPKVIALKTDIKRWKWINDCLRERDIHHDQRRHINCIRIHPTESERHFLEKCRTAYKLFKSKHDFLSEAWVTNRSQRFDILDLTLNEDYEIETGLSKKKKYKADKEVKV